MSDKKLIKEFSYVKVNNAAYILNNKNECIGYLTFTNEKDIDQLLKHFSKHDNTTVNI